MLSKVYKQNLLRAILWLAVIIWMTLIFGLSAQTAPESNSLSWQVIRIAEDSFNPGFAELPQVQQWGIIKALQEPARNTAHATLYFGLGLLCMMALYQYSLNTKVRLLAAFFISAGYAASDEIHQLFVYGRGCQLSDFGLDALGALTAIWLVELVHYIWRKKRACFD